MAPRETDVGEVRRQKVTQFNLLFIIQTYNLIFGTYLIAAVLLPPALTSTKQGVTATNLFHNRESQVAQDASPSSRRGQAPASSGSLSPVCVKKTNLR
jgi:hypothetical protein